MIIKIKIDTATWPEGNAAFRRETKKIFEAIRGALDELAIDKRSYAIGTSKIYNGRGKQVGHFTLYPVDPDKEQDK